MRPKQKNKIFTFICSCLPGAAEMYMGFMKMGFSLMAIFFLSFIIPSALRMSDMAILVGVLVWFYGFFHARNLDACDEEEFAMVEDIYIWEEFTDGRELHLPGKTARKWCGYALIAFGVVFIWQNFSYAIYSILPWEKIDQYMPLLDQIPQMIIALLIIALGLKLVKGKKAELDGE